MAFSINDLNYEKDSKERMPWEHYTEEFGKADPAEIAGTFLMMRKKKN